MNIEEEETAAKLAADGAIDAMRASGMAFSMVPFVCASMVVSSICVQSETRDEAMARLGEVVETMHKMMGDFSEWRKLVVKENLQ